MKIIEPSLLAYSNNENELKKELIKLKTQGIKSLHYDVMDGIFVSNTAFEGEHINLIKEIGFDITVHLMVKDVDSYLDKFLQYPLKAITFQCEAVSIYQNFKYLKKIKNHGFLAGIAIKPDTNFNDYKEVFKKVDLVTYMSVFPGKGGQQFISGSIKRVRELKKLLPIRSIIQIDGGINDLNMHLVKKDVEWFVMGSYSKDNINIIGNLQEELNE